MRTRDDPLVPDAELLGVTTNLDSGGRRARCVAYVLQRADRDDVPVTAGAAASLTTLARYESTWSDRRYMPDTIDPLPSPPGRGPHLFADNIAAGATVVAIGTHTNLGLLAVTLPGILDGVPVVAMGGWSIRPRGTVTVTVGTEMDWNVQRWWVLPGTCPTTTAGLPFHVARHAAAANRRSAEDVRFMAAVPRGAQHRAWFAV